MKGIRRRMGKEKVRKIQSSRRKEKEKSKEDQEKQKKEEGLEIEPR